MSKDICRSHRDESAAGAILVLCFCFLSSYTHADLNDALDDMFIATGNEATIYDTQRRLGIDAGYLRLRAPIGQYNLFNMTPPTFRAGCGGIDMHGGSFSFLNAEQFRQMLRQIGANAIGYAFQLALSSMCNMCNSVLSKLQEMATDLNRMQVDTCKWGMGLVDDFASSFDNKKLEMAKTQANASALVDDGMEAFDYFFTNQNEHATGGDPDGAAPGDLETGNWTINALTNGVDVSTLFSFPPSNLSHNELLMNIAGTFVYRGADGTEVGGGLLAGELEGLISYDDLARGRSLDDTGTGDLVPLYECEDEANGCLRVRKMTVDWNFEGVDNWVRNQLDAAATHMANPGTADDPHTVPIQTFLGSLPITVARHMQWLQGNGTALSRYVEVADDYIVDVYASSLALQMVSIVRASYASENSPPIPPVVRSSLEKFEADAKLASLEVNKEYAETWLKLEELVATLNANRSPFDSGVMIDAK